MNKENLNNKISSLKKILDSYEKIGIAFSGGVDSTFLLAFATEYIGKERVVGLTIEAPNFAPDEIEYTKYFCKERGLNHFVVDIPISSIDGFKENSKERCYYCKKSIFSLVKDKALNQGINIICDGTNLDDDFDYRPGKKALKELGIISPLRDAMLNKEEIRYLLKEMGISIWNKPAFACLASRIPYGSEITEEKLSAIYSVEKAIKNLGFSQVRVRHHGSIAIIELYPDDIQRFANQATRDLVCNAAKNVGFAFCTLDLNGYKMGNLNNT